jgi:hypothetical protein
VIGPARRALVARMCVCGHPRLTHGDGKGWRVCHAIRCPDEPHQFRWVLRDRLAQLAVTR